MTGGVHHNSTAQRAPRPGASRSNNQKALRIREDTGGWTPEPMTSRATSAACVGEDAGLPFGWVMFRDPNLASPTSAGQSSTACA
jgi:hypothetical protein